MGGKMYSDKELISMLNNKAKLLGRTPTTDDIRDCYRTAAISTFERRFGSWSKALKSAGLKTNSQKYSKENLLRLLRKKAEELGRTPSTIDINKDENMPSTMPYRNKFGKYSEACIAAGLKPNKRKGS